METFVNFPFFFPSDIRKIPWEVLTYKRGGQRREGPDVGHCLYVALSKSHRGDFQGILYVFVWIRPFPGRSEMKRGTVSQVSGDPRFPPCTPKPPYRAVPSVQPKPIEIAQATWCFVVCAPFMAHQWGTMLGNLMRELTSASYMHCACFSLILILSACTCW